MVVEGNMRSRLSWRVNRRRVSKSEGDRNNLGSSNVGTSTDSGWPLSNNNMEMSAFPDAKPGATDAPAKAPERHAGATVTAVDIDSVPVADNESGGTPSPKEELDAINFNEPNGNTTDSPLGTTTSHGGDGEEYPEGGVRAWLVVLGAWLALFASLGLMNILATFQTYISNNQLTEYDTSSVGWIFSLYTFVSFFMGIYVGPLFDKYGPRWLILSGTLCLVVSLILMSISYEFWHFLLAFGLMSGLASSLLFTPSIAAIGHFFKARRGFATGVAATAGSIGGIVFPLMLHRLFDTVGFAWAIRTLAFVCLAVTIISNFLIRARLPPAKDASPHPDIRIFRNKAFAWTTLAVFLLEFALFIPLTYISSYALKQGFSSTFATNLISILNAGSVVGRVLPGWYADKIGPFNANIMSVALTAAGCFAIWLPAGHTAPGIIIFALIFGFASGSNIALVPVSIGRLCKTQAYGRYYATCYTLVSVAVLIGIPIAGKIVDSNGGEYWGLIVTTGVVYLASLVAFAMVKVEVVGWRAAVFAIL
ncbi:riboflavin transporter MCH5 [Rhypophila decipiens]|uniref:Riboflavin transporter MCH5 n=1 Tax=Rhypophila decipiens TaxID=261697 RepID=A0AAN6Y7G6_9PEZI|nr:riboflavin transporter MCH5 [Rhypophila decipiens]